MLNVQARRKDDPTWIAEYEAVRRELRESAYEDDRQLLETHDRIIAMLDQMIEERSVMRTNPMKTKG